MSQKKPHTDIAKLQYEQAIEQLEDILDQVESGEISLEEALQHTERGAALIEHCRGILDRVEKRVTALMTTREGDLQATESDNDPPTQTE